MKSILHSNSTAREHIKQRLISFINSLPHTKSFQVTIDPYVKRRSDNQNSYLWGVVYQDIIDQGSLEGWVKEDIHEYFLGEYFGWETLEGFGKKRLKPLKRSSKLSTIEFTDYVDFIKMKCAELGIYIHDPDEYEDG